MNAWIESDSHRNRCSWTAMAIILFHILRKMNRENITPQEIQEDPIRKIDDNLTIYHSFQNRVIKLGNTSGLSYIDPFSKTLVDVPCRKCNTYFKSNYGLTINQVVNLLHGFDKDDTHFCPICGSELGKVYTFAQRIPKTCSRTCASILSIKEQRLDEKDSGIQRGPHSFVARAKANRTKFQNLGNLDDMCYLYLAVHEDFPDWYKFGVSDQQYLEAKAHRNGYASITKIVEGTRFVISNLEYRLALHFKSEWFTNSEDALTEFNYIVSELQSDKMCAKVVRGVNLNFIEPSITLIDSIDIRKEVWRISRPHLDPDDEKINDIQNLDLPVNGFAYYNFRITSSLLLRDLLYHIRPSADWGRSNRTVLLTEKNLMYSGEYSNEEYWTDKELEEHWMSVDQSISQDIRKHHFLYYVSTTYCWMVDARTISGVIRSLMGTPLAFYGEMLLSAMGLESVSQLVPGRSDFLFQYAIDDIAIDRLVESNSNAVADYYPEARQLNVISLMTGALLSQFIRQAYSIVRTDLVNDILNAKSFSELPKYQNTTRHGQVLISTEKAKKLVLTRSCWFGMFDKEDLSSWSHIVYAIITALSLSPEEILICEGCADKCKWKAEQLARLKAGNPNGSIGETNPPCIILTGIPELYELRQQKFGSNSALFHQWRRLIPGDLTLTEEGKEYLSNVAEYGYAEKRDNEALKGITEEILTKYKYKPNK